MAQKQKYIKLTLDAHYDEKAGGWEVDGTLNAYGKPPEIADAIATVLTRHNKSLSQMIALAILTGSPIPGVLNPDKTVIDLKAIENARG